MKKLLDSSRSWFVAPALLAVLVAGCGAAPPDGTEDWQTVAEKSGFTATSTHLETMDFLRRLARHSDQLHLSTFGTSAAGRDLPLVVVAADGAFTADQARRSGRPIVLIQSCIHPGEVDGKDASLLILRDMALGRLAVPEDVILLFVPILNADGHERISPHNRPNQNGPVQGMGFRTTASGLDLNRDHVKVDAPEMRALMQLFNSYRPHLHVDLHVTDGSRHEWVLTWSVAEEPLLAEPLHRWLQQHLPEALGALEEAGYPAGPYVSMVDRLDPTAGIDSAVSSPRFSTGYWALRNRPSVLVEMYSYAPFERRVMACREFVLALLDQVHAAGDDLVAAVTTAEETTAERGRPDAEDSEVVLGWHVAEQPDTVRLPLHEYDLEPSVVTGTELVRYRDTVAPLEVPWFHRLERELTVSRPRGYLVLPGWPQVEERLRVHGLVVQRLTAPLELEVETLRTDRPELASSSYQGHVRATYEVHRQIEQRTVPAGTLWIPADQPDFEVAAQLLEPEAADSLASWGFLLAAAERKEYIDARVLEDKVATMLEDPVVAAEWQAALEDPELAADTTARYMWWYRRTVHWDEQVGLLPVFRVLHPVPLAVEPW